jgi:hypothetical protein
VLRYACQWAFGSCVAWVGHSPSSSWSVFFKDYSQCRGMREPLLASSISGCGLEQYAEEQGEQGESVPAELSEPRNESRLYRALSGSNWKAGLSTVCELALISHSGTRSLSLLAGLAGLAGVGCSSRASTTSSLRTTCSESVGSTKRKFPRR